jgi:hypothetical protein
MIGIQSGVDGEAVNLENKETRMQRYIELGLVVLALTLASSPGIAAGKDKPSAEDITKICLAVADVCTVTCQEKNYGSVSDAIDGVQPCLDKCAQDYRDCVGQLPLKRQKKGVEGQKKKGTLGN